MYRVTIQVWHILNGHPVARFYLAEDTTTGTRWWHQFKDNFIMSFMALCPLFTACPHPSIPRLVMRLTQKHGWWLLSSAQAASRKHAASLSFKMGLLARMHGVFEVGISFQPRLTKMGSSKFNTHLSRHSVLLHLNSRSLHTCVLYGHLGLKPMWSSGALYESMLFMCGSHG